MLMYKLMFVLSCIGYSSVFTLLRREVFVVALTSFNSKLYEIWYVVLLVFMDFTVLKLS